MLGLGQAGLSHILRRGPATDVGAPQLLDALADHAPGGGAHRARHPSPEGVMAQEVLIADGPSRARPAIRGGPRAPSDHARDLPDLPVVLRQPGDARPRAGDWARPRAEAHELGARRLPPGGLIIVPLLITYWRGPCGRRRPSASPASRY